MIAHVRQAALLSLALWSLVACDQKARFFGGTTIDVTPPSVLAIAPANGSTAVELDSTVRIAFSEEMDPSTVNESTISLFQDGVRVPITVTYSGTSALLTSSRFDFLTPYEVLVSTTVSDLNNLSLGTEVSSSFTTRDLRWGIPVVVSSTGGGVSAASDPSGRTLAVWEQYDGVRFNLWASYFVDGSGWSMPEPIESQPGSASGVRVAVDGDSSAIAVWSQSDGTRDNIWAARFSVGSGWGAPVLLEDYDSGPAAAPQIAMNAAGRAMVVWSQSDGTRFNIYSANYIPGSGWAAYDIVETNNTGDARFPDVAIDSQGNAIAVWQQNDGTRDNIRAQRFRADAFGWGSPPSFGALLETDDAGDAEYPRVAMDGAGNALVVWQQRDAAGTRDIFSNRYDRDSGLWGSAVALESGARSAYGPVVASAASGDAMVVWHQLEEVGVKSGIWSNQFNGTTWAGAVRLDSETGNAISPQVGIDARNNAVVVWSQFESGRDSAWSARFVPSAGWGGPQLLEEDDLVNANYTRLTVSSSGRASALWLQNDGVLRKQWSSHLE